MAGILGGRLRLLDLANGQTHKFSGQYVISYDPEFHWPSGKYDGGELICTPDIDKAPIFDITYIHKLYLSGPTCKCHRLRPDGQPNRPLTAFNVEIG